MKGNNFISKYYTKKIKISFQSTVKTILNNKYFWEIKLDNSETIQAKQIILTCPFPQSKKIAGKYLEKKNIVFKDKYGAKYYNNVSF